MTKRGDAHVRRVVMYVVTTVWALSFVAHIIVSGYEPSAFIHMAMMTVLGALLGVDLIRNGEDDR